MSDELQASCVVADTNSIFSSDVLLTTKNYRTAMERLGHALSGFTCSAELQGRSRMQVNLMKGKIHCALVTQADLHYDGSISIDCALMEAAGFLVNERLEIYTGSRRM
ncbi:hypothetical protein GGD66_002469 [Bradyrhizobium sp. CIR48]|nr:hypothetical protein [Bradyrhizobium sp. CIR48]